MSTQPWLFPARWLTRSAIHSPQKEKREKREKSEKKERKEKRARDEVEAKQPEPSKEKQKKQKKQKKSDSAPVVESHPIDVPDEEVDHAEHGEEDEAYGEDGGRQGTAAKAFQRVKADEWLNKKGSWDNSYEGTFGQAGWGFKAQQILGQVRGKDFRHEKTKKKRGSYRGGLIDSNAVCSYKFDSDDE